ncbi:MAG: molybdenum cofactor biosynthesis protein MoaB [Myxococcales bacterium]|nr:molybdenum cofactor biosynthesis protein MoaB [Myxococcales bacterium]
MSHHGEADRKNQIVQVALVTVSDTRTEETDKNGIYLKAQLEEAGHRLVGYRIVKDEPLQVQQALTEYTTAGAQVIIFNGGTGVTARDNTYDAIAAMLQKTLPGFGELFRMLSWEQVGAAAMLSRAIAGVYNGAVVISTPGSSKAVQLAWEKLILPEMRHLAWEVGR